MRKTWSTILFLYLLLAFPTWGNAACFEEAAARYEIPVSLLKAISRVESSGNPLAVNRNTNGSQDVGHMQINSSWLPVLQRYGITEQSLLNPCINTYVGAWILAGNISQLGYNWNAVGAYNAKSQHKRLAYAQKVARVLVREGVVR